MKTTRTTLCKLLTVSLVFLATAAINAQVKTSVTETDSAAPSHSVKVETGTVMLVDGNDVWIKDSTGQMRHFPNVPESARVTVNGKQLGVHDLKPGMTIQRTTITTTTPKLVTTVKTVTGTVWHVNPPTSVILTLQDNKNQRFRIPAGQKFDIGGQMVDAWGLKKGMTVHVTQVIEAPLTQVTEKKILAGQMPPPPPPPPEQPILIAVSFPTPAPVQVAEAAQAPEAPQALPETGSPLPFMGLLGLLLLGASFGMRFLRQS